MLGGRVLSRAFFLMGYSVLLFQLCMWGVGQWKTEVIMAVILVSIYVAQKSDRSLYRTTALSGIIFVVAGEVYFRMHYFGPESVVQFSQYVPASLGHPLSSVPYDAEASYTGLLPGFRGVFKGGHFFVNQSGFRDKDWPVEKQNGTIRIAVLGTSMSMGSGVHQDESYPSVLQRMLDEDAGIAATVEVLNFGRGGYGPDDFVDMLGPQAMKYRPDVVLVEPYDLTKRGLHGLEGFKGTKPELIAWGLREPHQLLFFLRAIHNESGYMLMKRLRSAGRTMRGWFPRGGGSAVREADRGFDVQERTREQNVDADTEDGKSQARIADYLFRRIREIVGERKVFALILPPMNEFPVKVRVGDWLRRKCEQYGFELIDGLREDYDRGIKKVVIYVGDRHANAKTHRVFAGAAFRSIGPYLRKRYGAEEGRVSP